ncbi:hypothetical protein EAE96_010579 [Botrytis aclada]|nr:hypothetical protein EAE96_010579 [Botrytis aclada]
MGFLPPVHCLVSSSGLSSSVIIPIFLTTPSQTQSSPIIISSTTSIVAHSSSSVVSSRLSSLYSTANDLPAYPTTSVIETTTTSFPTASTTSTVMTSVDSFSATSSIACPALVARNDDDDDAALLAASGFHKFSLKFRISYKEANNGRAKWPTGSLYSIIQTAYRSTKQSVKQFN